MKKGQLLARIDDRDMVLQREVLVARLKAIENQIAAMQAQTGQVDQETLGKYQSETNRLAAAEAEVASLAVQVKQARDDYQRAQDLADAEVALAAGDGARAHHLSAGRRRTTARRNPRSRPRAARCPPPAAAAASSR